LGSFNEPLKSQSESLTCCQFNYHHQLFVNGTNDGRVEAWDYRDKKSIATLDCVLNKAIAMEIDIDSKFVNYRSHIFIISYYGRIHSLFNLDLKSRFQAYASKTHWDWLLAWVMAMLVYFTILQYNNQMNKPGVFPLGSFIWYPFFAALFEQKS
jgi:hypothetical protein